MSKPSRQSFDDWMRALLVLAITAILGLIVILSFRRAQTWDQTMELLNLFFPIATLVLGAAGGYYFGNKK